MRACLGYQLATFHLKTLLTTLLHRFDFGKRAQLAGAAGAAGVAHDGDEDLRTFIMFEFHSGLHRTVARRE